MTKDPGRDGTKPITVRPTLIVGVGGTGSLAVKNIKRCISEQLGRVEIPFIKILVIDTTTEEPYGMKLNEGEFINLGSIDVNEIIDRIELYPHLQSWFPSKQIRPMQTGLGAGGVRHIGRLYYFQWREGMVRTKIQTCIESLMNPRLPDESRQIKELRELNISVDMQHGIDVHIISSVVGGTGAGILLDLAYDLRRWCKEGAGSLTSTAHLVLPEAFTSKVPPMLHDQLQANAYTSLAEINHFTRHGKWRVKYQTEGVVEESRSPFDYIFLLNGQLEVGVRDHYELTSVIGKAIFTLVLTPLGSVILQKAINISQLRLGQTDPQYNEPLAYASYGISTAVLDKDSLRKATHQHLVQEITSRVSLPSNLIDKDVNAFAKQIGISHESLTELSPKVEEINWKDNRARDDHKFAGFEVEDYERQNEQNQKQEQRLWRERLNRVFSTELDDQLYNKLSRSWEERKSLSYLVDFVSAFRKCLVQLKEDGESAKRKLYDQKEKSRSEINSLPKPYGSEGLQKYAKLLLDVERAKYQSLFWDSLIDQVDQAASRIDKRFQKRVEAALEACRLQGKRISTFKVERVKLPPESFEFHSCEEIAKFIAKNQLDSAVQKFGHRVLEALGNSSPRLILEAQREFQDLPVIIAGGVAEDILKDYEISGGLDIHKIAEYLDEGSLKRTLRELMGASRPSVRLVGHYPMFEKQQINYIGAKLKNHDFTSSELNGSPIYKSIQELDPNFQAAPHNSSEIPIVGFLYGFPLWALMPAAKWEESFERKHEENTRVFLDPSWQEEIRPFLPFLGTERDKLLYFSLATVKLGGLITRDSLKEWRLENEYLGKTRYEAFTSFDRLLKQNRDYSIEAVKNQVDENLKKFGSTTEIIRFLYGHLRQLEAFVSGNGPSLDRKLIMREIWILKDEISRLMADDVVNLGGQAVSQKDAV